jgi:hypothetical protein
VGVHSTPASLTQCKLRIAWTHSASDCRRRQVRYSPSYYPSSRKRNTHSSPVDPAWQSAKRCQASCKDQGQHEAQDGDGVMQHESVRTQPHCHLSSRSYVPMKETSFLSSVDVCSANH